MVYFSIFIDNNREGKIIMGIIQEENEKLRYYTYESGEGVDYMSDMNNWVCVHLTKYEPKYNANDEMYIETTAMATGYRLPRASVHVTLNQIVANNLGGNWNDASIVVLAPYKDVVQRNVQPQEVAVEDTYFIPNQDTGLVLPESAYIVRPDSKSDKLFHIGEKGATYKTDNYTDEEVQEILSLSSWDKEKYDRYASGDFPEYEADRFLGYDEKLKKLYEGAKDKKAFMRGIAEEDKFVILNNLLRDFVVKLSLEKMGYYYVYAHEDNVSGKVAEVARKNGLPGNSGNKGHSNSAECALERHGCMLLGFVESLKSQDADAVYEYLKYDFRPLRKEFLAVILHDQPIPDFYKSLEGYWNACTEEAKFSYQFYEKNENVSDEDKQLYKNKIQKMEQGIKAYNPYLDTTLRRFSRRMTLECNQALNELKKNPEIYAEIKNRLREFDYDEENETEMKKPLWSGREGR